MAKKNKTNPMNQKKNLSKETLAVHGGIDRSPHGETSEAIYFNSGFTYENSNSAKERFEGNQEGHIYSRFSNPSVDMLQQRMALIEGAEDARATATGMAAVTIALMSQVKAGDHVVAARALFGSCRYVIEDFLPRWGVSSTLVDGRNPKNFTKAMQKNTKAIFQISDNL